MGVVMEEEEIWKCRKHPSRRRAVGVCPVCLRDRLISLCPNCANVRPCACCSIAAATTSARGGATTSSASSATTTATTTSSSFSLSSSSDRHRSASGGGGIGAVGRIASLIQDEPAFRRSRSAAFQFLRLPERDCRAPPPPLKENQTANSSSKPRSSSSIWSVFRASKTKHKECCDVVVVEEDEDQDQDLHHRHHHHNHHHEVKSKNASLMTRSKSAGGVSGFSDPARFRARSWHFPSPMKVFRHHPKSSKIVHERSPLCRG